MTAIFKGLYLVSTPIGNLGDISQRALETLAGVDFIAAEDTRVTLKLLNHFDISKPLVSYYQHNFKERGEQIVARILAGESCALVSDAGMPSISDPGEDLVRLCVDAGIPVTCIPGGTAAVTALARSGFDASRFCFEGFLSVARQTRREHLASLSSERRTMLFYEAPHKLRQTLIDFRETFGPDRRICLARELTKVHEEVIRTTIAQAIEHFDEVSPRGEFVLIVEGAPIPKAQQTFLEDAVVLAQNLMDGGDPPAQAAREAARITGCKKSEIYKLLVEDR